MEDTSWVDGPIQAFPGDKTENSNGLDDYWIVKTDSLGTIEWQNTIGGNSDDRFYSLQQTKDGGYILGGRSVSNISGDKTENSMGNSDYWIVKTDNLGTIEWQNTIGGVVMMSLLLYNKPQMRDTSWADIPIQIFRAIKQRMALVTPIIGS
ncbi:MAG: hypothetical protein IPP71_21345 [Bacteroidetes bacterium]|nr:hypothetical protein [Bacteroidota bacterium]